MEVSQELITKLADDVWAAGVEAGSHNYELEKKLKRLSGCLHNIRAGHDTKWYLDLIKKKEEL